MLTARHSSRFLFDADGISGRVYDYLMPLLPDDHEGDRIQQEEVEEGEKKKRGSNAAAAILGRMPSFLKLQ